MGDEGALILHLARILVDLVGEAGTDRMAGLGIGVKSQVLGPPTSSDSRRSPKLSRVLDGRAVVEGLTGPDISDDRDVGRWLACFACKGRRDDMELIDESQVMDMEVSGFEVVMLRIPAFFLVTLGPTACPNAVIWRR